MKRLISIICIFTLLLGLCSASYAAEEDYTYDSVYEELLSELGFITPVISDSMTRYELSEILVKMLNYNAAYYGDGNPFTDMDEQNGLYPVMKSAYNLGILSGGTARPNDVVNYNEAVKMVVSAIGYAPYAPYKGGWPTGYITIANEIDILDDVVSNGEAISRDSLYALLYNMMHANILEVDSVGGDELGYGTVPGRNVLTYYHGLTIGEGILQGVRGLSMLAGVDIALDEVYVDGKLLKDTTNNSHKLVGHNTRYYYDADTKELKAVVAFDSDQITISSDDVYDYKDKTLYTEKDGKETRYNFNSSTKIIYNGQLIDSFSKDLLVGTNGEITLIKNASNNVINVAIVKDIKVIVVGSVDYNQSVIYDYYDKDYSDGTGMLTLDIDDSSKSILFKDEIGNDMSVKELVRGDVISYTASGDGNTIEAYYSNTEIIGSIDEVSENGDVKRVTIDGESYKTTENFSDKENIQLGANGAFRLTIDKRVAYVNYDNTAKYAYLVAGMQEQGLSGKCRIKVFNIDSKMVELTLPEKLEFNGKSEEATAVYNSLLNGSRVKRQFIRYEQNSNNEVTMIDTVGDPNNLNGESENSLMLAHSTTGADADKWRDTGTFGGKVPVNQSGPMFVIPDIADNEDAEDKYYSISTPYKYFTHDLPYAVQTYKTNADEIMGDVVVYRSPLVIQIGGNTGIGVVKAVSQVSVDGDSCKKATIFYNGAEKDYYIDDTTVLNTPFDGGTVDTELSCGDIVRFASNDLSFITTLVPIYNCESTHGKFENGAYSYNPADANAPNNLLAPIRIAKGEVFEQVSGIILFKPGANVFNGTTTRNDADMECYKSANYKIYFYDSEARYDKLKLGSAADISAYRPSENPSTIIVQSRNGFDGTIVVYK